MKKSSFYKNLLIIAFPIMIQYFITSSINMMDSFMIGKLGEEAVASLGIANQYFFVFNLILMGIYSGCNVLIAQFFGKKDVMSIRKILGISLTLGISVSVVFFIVARFFSTQIMFVFNQNPTVIEMGKSYLQVVCISYIFMAISLAFGIGSRGVQKAFLPMTCSAVALIVNIIFNYALIFGHFNMPALGVEGAAVATLIARISEMVLILIFVYGKKHILGASMKELLAFDLSFFKKAMNIIVPVVINELCWGLGTVIYSVIYGNMGTKSIAAVQICMVIQNMFLIVLFAISNASCVMVGNEVGKDDFDTAKSYAHRLIGIGLMVSVVMAISLFLSSRSILKIYNVSNEVYTSALYMLWITAAILPIRFMNTLFIAGILRGGGDTSYVLRVELTTMWLIGVPLCIIGVFCLNLSVCKVFLLVTLEEIIKCFICLMRYRSGKWLKNVVDNMNHSIEYS